MNIVTKLLSTAVGLTMSAGLALAEPAIIFDLEGKFDKSFNGSAFTGAQRWADETGGSFREISFKMKPNENKLFGDLQKLGLTLLSWLGLHLLTP